MKSKARKINERYNRRMRFLCNCAELLALPPDALVNCAHLELINDSFVYIQCYGELIELSHEEIAFQTTNGDVIAIFGSEMKIDGMTDERIKISGKINKIEYNSHENK